MKVTDKEKFREWLLTKFGGCSDAEPAALARYTLALTNSADSVEALRHQLVTQLLIFTGSKTDELADDIVNSLTDDSYMTFFEDRSEREYEESEEYQPIDINQSKNCTSYSSSDSFNNRSLRNHKGHSRNLSRLDRSTSNNSRRRRRRIDSPKHHLNRESERRHGDYSRRKNYNRGEVDTIDSVLESLKMLSTSMNPGNLKRKEKSGNSEESKKKIYPPTFFSNNVKTTRGGSFKIDSSLTALQIIKIPAANRSSRAINAYFKRFGEIRKIVYPFLNDDSSALIVFVDHEGAKRAYTSPVAVFRNRFVKLFWYKGNDVESFIAASDLQHNEKSTDEATIASKPMQPKSFKSKFISPEFLENEKRKKIENIENSKQVKDLRIKLLDMCLKEQHRLAELLKDPEISEEQKEEITETFNKIIEKKESLLNKDKAKQFLGGKTQPIVKKPKTKLVLPNKFAHRLDRRSSTLFLDLAPVTNADEIVNYCNKFGKITKSNLINDTKMIIKFTTHAQAYKMLLAKTNLPPNFKNVTLIKDNELFLRNDSVGTTINSSIDFNNEEIKVGKGKEFSGAQNDLIFHLQNYDQSELSGSNTEL